MPLKNASVSVTPSTIKLVDSGRAPFKLTSAKLLFSPCPAKATWLPPDKFEAPALSSNKFVMSRPVEGNCSIIVCSNTLPSVVLSVCTICVSEVTCKVSLTEPKSRRRSSRSVWSTSSTSPVLWSVLNPCASTVSSYVPGTRFTNTKSPTEFV